MIRHILLFFIVPVFIFSVGCTVAYAVSIPQELFISSAGQMWLRGGEVKLKNAANVIVVEIWGQRWTVLVDYATKLESAYGEAIKLEEIAVGHTLEVKGRPIADKMGYLDASMVRDLAIATGTVSQGASNLLVDQLCAVQIAASLEKTKAEMQSKLTASGITALSSNTLSSPPAQEFAVQKKDSEANLPRELEFGMKGSDVLLVQKFLVSKGYDIGYPTATGFFGNGTVAAVKKFQKANGLPQLGRMGPATRALLQEELKK